MAKVDYVIRNGRVIDPLRGIDETMDIAVKNGEIVSADNADGTEVDAAGCLVVPGLIDFHCHVGAYVTDLGIAPETSYLPTGVTTVVDAGTTGTANYEAFRRLTLCSRLRIKAFLNDHPGRPDRLPAGLFVHCIDPQRGIQQRGIPEASGIKAAAVPDPPEVILHRVDMLKTAVCHLLQRHFTREVQVQQIFISLI